MAVARVEALPMGRQLAELAGMAAGLPGASTGPAQGWQSAASTSPSTTPSETDNLLAILSMLRRNVLRRMALMPLLGVECATRDMSTLSLEATPRATVPRGVVPRGTTRRGTAAAEGGDAAVGGGEAGRGGGDGDAKTHLLGVAGEAAGLGPATTESWLANQ